MYINIKNDVFDIAKRLKEIDGGYYILYNTKNKKYQIHNSRQHGGTYCLTLPYDTLDSRAVEYVKSTQREYIENVLREIERNNESLQRQKCKEAISRAADKMYG